MATYDTSRYTKLYEDYEKQENANAQKKKDETNATYDQRLKQAYVTSVQGQKALNETLAKAGIRGGASESAILKAQNNYANNVNTINSERNQAIRDIDSQSAQNKFEYKQTTDMAANSYIEGREAEDRQTAQAEADKKAQADAEYWTAKYGGVTDKKTLKTALANAETIEEQTIIQARMNWIDEDTKAKSEEEKAKKEEENKTYWEAKYSTWYSISKLNKRLEKAKTKAEKSAILARIGYLKAQKKGH